MTHNASVGNFVSAASFWKPQFVDPSSFWLEHAPFSFWLVDVLRPRTLVELGTYRGFSYLSFCQAVAQLEIPSRAFAVDTWKGDEHMGAYGEEVLIGLTTYHDPRYSAFSRLVPSSFDDAHSEFDDGSIDLLHLDGVHTYEAVRHDFETWLPKLSDRAVVLFHDTNVRQQGFGVHRLWAELRTTYPGFEFIHGQGLGVLGVGTEKTAPVAALMEAAANPTLTVDVRAVYAHLGDAIKQQVITADLEAHASRLQADLDNAEAERSRQADIARTFEEQAAAAQARLFSSEAQLAQLRAEFEAVLRSESWRITAPLRGAMFRVHRLVFGARRVIRLRTRLRQFRGRRQTPDSDSEAQSSDSINPLDELLGTLGRRPAILQLEGEAALPDNLRDEAIAAMADGWAARMGARPISSQLSSRPLVSVLLPAFNTPPRLLELAVDSVLRQTYTNWELIVVDDGSTSKAHMRTLNAIQAKGDPRIRIVRNSVNRGIAHATNDALRSATGEFVALLDHDDELLPDALLEVIYRIDQEPDLDVVYTDQEYADLDGRSSGFLLKPDWSPTLFQGVMFVGHLLVVRRSVAEAVGGFDPAFDNVQDFDFMLRVSEHSDRIAHIPKVLYRWRRVPGSVAFHGDEKLSINDLQARAVTAHLKRRGAAAVARPNPRHAHRAELVVESLTEAAVSIVLWPSTDEAAVGETLRGLAQHAGSAISSVVVCGAPSYDLNRFGSELPLVGGDSSWARALGSADSEFVLSLEPGLVPETGDWLPQLLFHTSAQDVAAVSSVIVKSGGLVDESGLILGLDGDFGAAMRGLVATTDGYAGSLACSREVSAVSGRSALISREMLGRLGGPGSLFAGELAWWVDLSLRARCAGLRNIVSSQSIVRRVTPVRPDMPIDPLDAALLRELWGDRFAAPDPYHNPNFARVGGGYRLRAREPRVVTEHKRTSLGRLLYPTRL